MSSSEAATGLQVAILEASRHGVDVSREWIRDEARRRMPLAHAAEIDAAVSEVLAARRGMGPLEPFLTDPTLSDVLVNGDGRVWIESAGEVVDTGVRVSPDQVMLMVEHIVGPLGLRVDRSSPMVDARLPDGSRVNVILPPLSIDGPCVTIRRFGTRPVPLGAFCSPEVAGLLAGSVAGRMNILVSGGTGAGKTTLLNALAVKVDAAERIVTVEDSAELRLGLPHVVRLEARPASAEGLGEVGIRDLVRNALRMRPDRLVVGEVRGGEALEMLQAMNTGHDGSLSTCHANSPDDALRRIETMVLLSGVALPLQAVREQIRSAIDLVIQVARGARSGDRRVVEVAEVRQGRVLGTRSLVLGDSVVSAPQRPRRHACAGWAA